MFVKFNALFFVKLKLKLKLSVFYTLSRTYVKHIESSMVKIW